VMAKAIEMASQDAETMNRQGMANQGYENEFAGREQTQNYTKENNHLDYLYKGDLMRQDYGYQGSMMDRDYGHRGNLLDQEYGLRDQSDAAASDRAAAVNAQSSYTSVMSTMQREYQQEYARITQNADISPEEQVKFVDNLNARYKVMYDDINAIYEAMPMWEDAWSVAWGNMATAGV
jgi:hypothetical protein